MYIKEMYIEGNGAIDRLHLTPSFDNIGNPKPFLLVGGNGSGKTNVLSMAADAVIETAAAHYNDTTPTVAGGRAWFRLVGNTTIKSGHAGSVCIMRLAHGEHQFAYLEKAGHIDAAEIKERAPESIGQLAAWETDGNFKHCGVSSEISKAVFESGVYAYFPSSRAETPYWLNQGSIPKVEFDLNQKFSNRLGKPIFIEKGLDHLKQWLLSVLLGVRVDVLQLQIASVQPIWIARDASGVAAAHTHWANLNEILRVILDSETASLVWLGRNHKSAIGYLPKATSLALPLESLSAGQGTLFNIFATLMRYGDGTTPELPSLSRGIEGVCVIDEIDSHMHIDLQYRAIPALLNLFPKVQFILSSHSPLFLLGMEKLFAADGFDIYDMPSGKPVQPEAYSEFERALQVLRQTQAFNDEILASAQSQGKLLVFVEGETDPIYIATAAKALERATLLDEIEIEWIGAKDPKRGEGFNTGKDSLNAAYSFLRAKPELVTRPVCFLYDNDTRKADTDEGKLSIRMMPANEKNSKIKFGVENLLSEDVFTEDVYDTKDHDKGNGTSTIVRSLNKMRLCQKLCGENYEKNAFQAFTPVLEILASIARRFDSPTVSDN